jgi:two-component system, LuxR family, sensor kinase FixL
VKKEEVVFAPLDLAGVIRDVAALINSDAILHGVRILLELNPGLPPARGDKVQLQQVVLNLLLNAFDAMKDCPANEREVKVRAETTEAGLLRLAVRDRGRVLTAIISIRFFNRSTRPNAMGSAWGYRSAVRSSKPTGGVFGRRTTPIEARRFTARYA